MWRVVCSFSRSDIVEGRGEGGSNREGRGIVRVRYCLLKFVVFMERNNGTTMVYGWDNLGVAIE